MKNCYPFVANRRALAFPPLFANHPFTKSLFSIIFFLFSISVSVSVSATDFSKLNYNGESSIPTGYTCYGSSAGKADTQNFSTTKVDGVTVFDVTAGGTGDYNKRCIEFTIDEDCSVEIELHTGNDGRIFRMYNGSKTAVKELTLAKKGQAYTFSHVFEGATESSPQTYSFSGSGSKVYIAKITFTPKGGSAGTPVCPSGLTILGSTEYTEGNTIELTAKLAAGNGDITYRWYKNNTLLTGKNGNKLTINDCTLDDAGDYTCTASKTDCSEVNSTPYTVTVQEDPRCFIFTSTGKSFSGNLSAGNVIDVVGGTMKVYSTKSSSSLKWTTDGLSFSGGQADQVIITTNSMLVSGSQIALTITQKQIDILNEKGDLITTLKSSSATYEIKDNDGLAGTNVFRLRRNESTVLKELSVSNCGGEAVLHTITFDMNGATSDAIAAQSVLDGGKVTKPADPTLDGKVFAGWIVASTGAIYDWETAVTADIVLKATWKNVWNIAYVETKGTDITKLPTTYVEGEGVSSFAKLENTDDFVFVGWQPASISAEATGNVTISAQWREAAPKYGVKYYDADGTNITTKQVEVGSLPETDNIAPEKLCYRFSGWSATQGGAVITDWEAYTSTAANTTISLYAVYTVKAYAQTADLYKEASGAESAIETFMTDKGYEVANATENGSAYDTGSKGYEGYKFKTQGATIAFVVKKGSVATVTFGYTESGWEITQGSTKETYTHKERDYQDRTFDATAGDLFVQLVNKSANAKTSAINKIVIEDKRTPTTITESLGGATFNGTPLTQEQSAALLENHTWTADGEFADAPTVVFTKHIVNTYEDGDVAETDESITVKATSVDGKWQAQCTISETTYTIEAAMPSVPSLKTDLAEDAVVTLQSQTIATATATLHVSGLNLAGDVSLRFPNEIEGLTVSPTTLTPQAGALTNAEVVLSYKSLNEVAESTVSLIIEQGETQVSVLVHYSSTKGFETVQPISTTTTWNFAKSHTADQTSPNSSGLVVFANLSGWAEGFNAEAIAGQGTTLYKSGKFQGHAMQFHTTVPGRVTVMYANTGDTKPERNLFINEQPCTSTTNQNKITVIKEVAAGDVNLEVRPVGSNTEELTAALLNIFTLTFEPTPAFDYTRMVTPGLYGTICLPGGVDAGGYAGMEVYELAYMHFEGETPDLLYLDLVTEMQAGMPYIFLATADKIQVTYNETSSATPLTSATGLVGTFTAIHDQAAGSAANVLEGNYIIAQNQFWLCGGNCWAEPNRAYISKDCQKDATPAPVGRKRVALGNGRQDTPTGLEGISENNVQTTLQGTYDVLGRKVTEPVGAGLYIQNGKKVIIYQ